MLQKSILENKEIVIAQDGEVILYPTFFSHQESESLLLNLERKIAWRQDYIKIHGKTLPVPRLTAFYGEPNITYTYSRITMHSQGWIPELLDIKERIEPLAQVNFNSVLLNLYRTGRDSMAWHSDDEPELGKNPAIASVSFGETRRFMLKHKYSRDLSNISVDLTSGSLLLMQGSTQHFWQHQIPKTRKPIDRRINLTFRTIR